MVVGLWEDRGHRGVRGGHEVRHHAPIVHLQLLLHCLLLEHGRLLVRSVRVLLPLFIVFQSGVELGRWAAPRREQKLNVPGCLAVVIEQLL